MSEDEPKVETEKSELQLVCAGVYSWAGDDESVAFVPSEFIEAMGLDDSNAMRLAAFNAIKESFEVSGVVVILIEEEPLEEDSGLPFDTELEPGDADPDADKLVCLYEDCEDGDVRVLNGDTVECQKCWRRTPLTHYQTSTDDTDN